MAEYSDSLERSAERGNPRRSESEASRLPLTLALDTGSPISSVALASGGELLATTSFASGEAEGTLLARIHRMTRQCGCSVQDLERTIGAGGPGSFTGLRIGLATLLGLHLALDIPSTAVSSFLPLARQAVGDLPVVAAVDALRGEWFAQRFPAGSSDSPDADPAIVEPAELAGWAPCRIVGFGVTSLNQTLPGNAGIELQEARPLAPELAALAESRHLDWSPSALTRPSYLRPPASR